MKISPDFPSTQALPTLSDSVSSSDSHKEDGTVVTADGARPDHSFWHSARGSLLASRGDAPTHENPFA